MSHPTFTHLANLRNGDYGIPTTFDHAPLTMTKVHTLFLGRLVIMGLRVISQCCNDICHPDDQILALIRVIYTYETGSFKNWSFWRKFCGLYYGIVYYRQNPCRSIMKFSVFHTFKNVGRSIFFET